MPMTSVLPSVVAAAVIVTGVVAAAAPVDPETD
jgi:hypothetical protein